MTLFIFVLFSLGIILNGTNSACVSLRDSKSCPGFAKYSIDTLNGIFPLNETTAPHYTDVVSFDSYVIKYAEFIANYLAKYSSCNIEEIKNDAISNLRYIITYACNFIINSKENSCQLKKPKVCKSVCETYVSFSNSH